MKKAKEIFQLKKKVKDNFFCNYPTFIFEQKLFIIHVSQMNILHKLYFHVRYKKAYHYK